MRCSSALPSKKAKKVCSSTLSCCVAKLVKIPDILLREPSVATDERPRDHGFYCFDRRLADAAGKERFSVYGLDA